ncbi:hypothetical protein AB4Y45_27985 [Paraburkholderia sp. EG287A]|uniref:hypothetical protein n=1 Tax=Paraburkholderia sp. EG287A TaxID=3237012 RepID=UPI0034D30130
MWLMLNDSFLSIVDAAKGEGCLLVRARREGDIERAFKDFAEIITVDRTPGRDYLFRAEIPRAVVARMVAERVLALNYPNFKGSVNAKDRDLHDAYFHVWSTMEMLQPMAAFSAAPRRTHSRQRSGL